MGKEAHVVARFEQEAMAVAKLRHPNIVTAYDFGRHSGRPGIRPFHVRGLAHEGEQLAARVEGLRLCRQAMHADAELLQDAARIVRRSGTLVELGEEERRIFEAVVKPERAKADGGNLEAELERLRGEIARAEGMLANERFVQGAPESVVEAEREKLEQYRRELDALSR